MVLFTTQDATITEKCAIANELLDGFSKIPIGFLRAISSPLLYHLAGIGSILGQVMIKGLLSESAYSQIRNALLNMADLLASLETTISRHVGATERLRSLTSGIDSFMISQRQQESYGNSSSPSTYNAYLENSASGPVSQPSASMSITSLINRSEPDGTLATSTHWNSGYQQAGLQGTADSTAMQVQHTSNMEERGGGGSQQLEFQIPPELLEDWPWPLDMTQDIQAFPGFLAPGLWQ